MRAAVAVAQKQRSSWSARQTANGQLREARRSQKVGRWSAALRRRSGLATVSIAVCRQAVFLSITRRAGVLRTARVTATSCGRSRGLIGRTLRRCCLKPSPRSVCRGGLPSGPTAASVSRGRPLAAIHFTRRAGSLGGVSRGLSPSGAAMDFTVIAVGRQPTESGRDCGLLVRVRVVSRIPLIFVLRDGGGCTRRTLPLVPAMFVRTAVLPNSEGPTGGGSRPIYVNDCTQTGHS